MIRLVAASAVGFFYALQYKLTQKINENEKPYICSQVFIVVSNY